MKFLSAFTLTLLISFSTGITQSYGNLDKNYYGDDFNDDEVIFSDFQDDTEENAHYKSRALDETSGYPTIDKQSKYYKLGKELGKYVKRIYKAVKERDEDAVCTMRGELKSLEQTAELQKLNYHLSQKKDIVSCAKLATFIAGLCSKLNIQDLHDLESYTPLKEDITLWTKIRGSSLSDNFSQQLSQFLSEPYQFPLFASLYQHALAL